MITSALNYITWTANPTMFSLFGRDIRWYGLMFAIGFGIGYWIVSKMWKKEQLNEKWIDKLLFYTLVGTILGARLGHCLFYAPGYYLANPIEILKTWEGGLASHGGVIGIIIAIYFFSKYVSKKPMMWTFDRLVVPTGLVAAMIRFGNLMNHEIYGHETTQPWGFKFVTNVSSWLKGAEPIFTQPSHPTQIYEALCYLTTFVICMWLYWKKEAYRRQGLLFGIFMLGIFVSRFFIEFVKNNQEDFEANMTLNMGQWLSIPFIIIGGYYTWKGLKTEIK